MFRSEHDTPLLERPSSDKRAPASNGEANVHRGADAPVDVGRPRARRRSFLLALLRALSAWNV